MRASQWQASHVVQYVLDTLLAATTALGTLMAAVATSTLLMFAFNEWGVVRVAQGVRRHVL